MNIVTVKANLNSIPLADKQIIYVIDEGTIYADFHNGSTVERKVYSTDADVSGFEDRLAALEAAASRLSAI